MTQAVAPRLRILREVRDSTDPCGAPFVYDETDSNDRDVLRRLKTEKLIGATQYSCAETLHYILTEDGKRELQKLEAETLSRSSLAIAINWFGALSRAVIALVSILFGLALGFFAENVSPNYYCSKLPSGFAAILTPCEPNQEGNLQ